MAGSLQIPNVFLNASPAAISTLDADFSTIAGYINLREITLGTLAARPAAGNAGALYCATDVSGGTLYEDNGLVWSQIAGGVVSAGGGLAGPTPVFF